mgnify:CR=1 FL=1
MLEQAVKKVTNHLKMYTNNLTNKVSNKMYLNFRAEIIISLRLFSSDFGRL